MGTSLCFRDASTQIVCNIRSCCAIMGAFGAILHGDDTTALFQESQAECWRTCVLTVRKYHVLAMPIGFILSGFFADKKSV